MTNLPFEIIIKKKENYQAADWCQQRWGKRWSTIDNRQGVWCCFWLGTRGPNSGKYIYHFKNEQDAIVFSLRWS